MTSAPCVCVKWGGGCGRAVCGCAHVCVCVGMYVLHNYVLGGCERMGNIVFKNSQ